MNAQRINEPTEEMFEDFLDEVFGTVDIAGYTFNTSYALKEIDPIAFNVGYADWESEQDEEWECDECGYIYDNEEDAEACCQPEEESEEDEYDKACDTAYEEERDRRCLKEE